MRRRTFILGLALGALPLTACSSEATPEPTGSDGPASASAPPRIAPSPTKTSPPVKTYGLNELVSVKNWDLAIQKVERRGTKLALSQFSNVAVARGLWFLILVDMKNTSSKNLGVTPDDFALTSGEATYPLLTSPEAFGYSESRGGRRIGDLIPPGVSVTYYTIFDVPPDATDLHLTFKQDTNPVFAVGNATL
jgi:hypothetical protein